ncbi:MAG TPA: hypothetical protein VIG33_12405 [Pseudobdellovibrionaceae bacterium]
MTGIYPAPSTASVQPFLARKVTQQSILFSGAVTDKVNIARKKVQEEAERAIFERANLVLDEAFFTVGETEVTGREVLKLIDEMGKTCECKVGKALSSESNTYYPWNVQSKLAPLVEAGLITVGTRVVPKNGYLFHHSLKLTERGREVAYASASYSEPADAVEPPSTLLEADSTNYPED